MNHADILRERLKNKVVKRPARAPTESEMRLSLAVDPQETPAPHIEQAVKAQGSEVFRQSLSAWENRVKGVPIVDISAAMGVSIETAKQLISQAHDAVTQDLKEALAMNRELDLHRLDGLIRAWYPHAVEGDEVASNIILKCIHQRARLTGAESLPDPGRQQPANILVWIQQQLPSINRIVDALPVE